MSPGFDLDPFGGLGFPRVSGDEPITLDVKGASVEFSPRERG